MVALAERIEGVPPPADGVPSPVAKQCPESFAPAKQFGGVVEEHVELWGDARDLWTPIGEQLVDPRLDQIN
jgi:hypothetical protein